MLHNSPITESIRERMAICSGLTSRGSIAAILRLIDEGCLTTNEICARHGVSQGTVEVLTDMLRRGAIKRRTH